MKWAHSLIRIASYEIDHLQKRLKDIENRHESVKDALQDLDREAERERDHAKTDTALHMAYYDYKKAWLLRKEDLENRKGMIEQEMEGARDALALVFEHKKKIEHMLSLAKTKAANHLAKVEMATLDDIAIRQKITKRSFFPG